MQDPGEVSITTKDKTLPLTPFRVSSPSTLKEVQLPTDPLPTSHFEEPVTPRAQFFFSSVPHIPTSITDIDQLTHHFQVLLTPEQSIEETCV